MHLIHFSGRHRPCDEWNFLVSHPQIVIEKSSVKFCLCVNSLHEVAIKTASRKMIYQFIGSYDTIVQSIVPLIPPRAIAPSAETTVAIIAEMVPLCLVRAFSYAATRL